MKLIVGLGNPGPRYAGTRHNVGFEIVDLIAAGPGTGPFRRRFEAQVAEVAYGTETLLLVKPETFMNLSGRSVKSALDFYKLEPAGLLVICDDMALPLGKLRVRVTGSHGGHNGLRDIQQQLGTADYPRMKVGVGAPADEATDHVLGRFRSNERKAMAEAVQIAAEAALVWVRDGVTVCMNKYNGEPLAKKPASQTKKRKPESSNDTPSTEVTRPTDAD